jgi:hypothetical protein
VKAAAVILKDAFRHDGLRGAAAIMLAALVDHARRKSLVTVFPSVSPFVQAAIYYSTRHWPAVERGNAKASWATHGALNPLLALAMSKT